MLYLESEIRCTLSLDDIISGAGAVLGGHPSDSEIAATESGATPGFQNRGWVGHRVGLPRKRGLGCPSFRFCR